MLDQFSFVFVTIALNQIISQLVVVIIKNYYTCTCPSLIKPVCVSTTSRTLDTDNAPTESCLLDINPGNFATVSNHYQHSHF